MQKGKQYILHAVIWLLFYLFPYLLSHRGQPNVATLFSDSGDVVHLVSFLLLILFSYVNYFVLVPRFYLSRNYLVYAGMVAVSLLIVIWAPNGVEVLLVDIPHRPPGNEPHPILFGMNYNIILFLLSVVLSIAIQSRVQLLQIEKEKLRAELSFLKAQINPHFLFNSLNSIYSLAIQESKDTPEAITLLANLMRYVMREASAEYVLLQKEFDYIHNYIELQKIRLGNTVQIECSLPTGTSEKRIAPLLLISFIENAFKHGVSPDEPSHILIQASLQESNLAMTVSNKLVKSTGKMNEGGIGLENTLNRLKHLYPNRHELRVVTNDTNYTINLTMELE